MSPKPPKFSGEMTKILLNAQQHLQCGQPQKAAELLFDILTINPDNNQILDLLADITKSMDNTEFSENIFRKLAVLYPNHLNILRKLIVVLTDGGKYAETLQYLKKCLKQNPHDVGTLTVLGNNLINSGQYYEAADAYRKALNLKNGLPPQLIAHIYANLALALSATGESDPAIAAYNKSLAIEGNNAEVHRNLAVTLLMTGDFTKGFAEYEWRKKISVKKDFFENYANGKPYWQGEEFRGKRLLVHHEQGLGDTLHFCRYLPQVKKLGGTIIFLVPKSLKALYKDFLETGVIDVLAEQNYECANNLEYDLVVPLLSLPYVLGSASDEIPVDVPYLFAEKDLTLKWREKITAACTQAGGDTNNLRVGLVWAGNALFPQDVIRSFPLMTMTPLSFIPDVDYYSLQVGDAAKEAQNPPEKMRFFDLTGHIDDFADTAALIENLDLVISVDTAVAHLAGAMGKPVWTLLYYANDWRWFKHREDSLWYQTMRLFRQESPNDWDNVIDRVAKNLYDFQKNHKR